MSQSRPFSEAGLGWDHWAHLGFKGRSGVTERYLYWRQPSMCTSEVYLWDEVPWQAQVWPSCLTMASRGPSQWASRCVGF